MPGAIAQDGWEDRHNKAVGGMNSEPLVEGNSIWEAARKNEG